MKNSSRGFSLIEILGAMAIGSMMLIGLNAIIDNAMEDSKGQQAALYQKQLVAAVSKYLNNFKHYDELQKKAAVGPVALDLSDFSKEYLPLNFSPSNIYQHHSCVLVKRRAVAPEKLDVLIVGNGGMAIAEKEIAAVAAMAGLGNGYLVGDRAKGAAWELSASELAAFNAVQCPGQTSAAAGHLASALFFDGPGQLSTDFLYRNAVPGRPELNSMNAELRMKNAMIRLDMAQRRDVGSSDDLCSASNSDSPGRIALDTSGGLVSCQNGKWARSGYWRDPVVSFAALPGSDNQQGDVRMVQALSRAFTWNGTQWRALAVDQDGNLALPGRLSSGDAIFSRVVVAKSDCEKDDPDGTMARDASGLILSCQNRLWQSQTDMAPQPKDNSCAVIIKSIKKDTHPDCKTGFLVSDHEWNDGFAVWRAHIPRVIKPTKNALINVNVWLRMNRDLASDVNVTGQARLLVDIVDNDTGELMGQTSAESVRLVNSSATINATMSMALKRNNKGYTVNIAPIWNTGQGPNGVFNEANYQTYNGTLVEQDPLSTGWNIDWSE